MRKALYLLGILNDVDIDWLAANGSIRVVRAGETLIHEKKPIESLYLLLDGELSITVGGPSAQQLAILYPGEIVGEISFVDSRPPSASVTAVRGSKLLMIHRDVISAKLEKDQAFAARFYRALAKFLADRLHVTVGRFGYGSAQQDADPDELPDSDMDQVDLAAVRIDKLMRRLQSESTAA